MENQIDNDSFDSLNLKLNLLRGIYAYNYENPTYVQLKAIPEILAKRDVIIETTSCTGKTATLVISSLQLIDNSKPKEVQALILTSTRELAQNIKKLCSSLSEYLGFKIYAFIGGTSIKDDIKKLSEGCQIVVGTPGRLLDMINKKILSLSDLKIFLIDDINEIIDRGFSDSIKNLVSHLNPQCQKVISSHMVIATQHESLVKMNNPVKIVKENQLCLKGVNQFYISVKQEWKLEILLNLYKLMEISQAIVYCNEKKTAETLYEDLNKNGFAVGYIHDEKEKVLSNFKAGYLRILISTSEFPAKEIDIYQSSVVINYDIPKSKEEYIIRVGRHEVFGKKGTIINFTVESDKGVIQEISQTYKKSMEELPIELSSINKSFYK